MRIFIMNRNNQRGFTLVEIAIVLVIIGLLLGGILKGQELINSAKVRNLVDMNSGVQAAYYGFIDRYRKIPGDLKAADSCTLIGSNVPGCSGTTGSVGGDGSGKIEKNKWNEAAAFWAHLQAAGFINGTFSGTATSTTYDNKAAPANPFGGFLLFSNTSSYKSSVGSAGEKGNLALGKMPAKVAAEIDVKLDDGDAGKGIVRAPLDSGSDFSPITDGVSGCSDVGNTVAWNAALDSDQCNAIFLY
jgi:prepilin-type N-terminal cleavage/methylation domain-containing protein